MSTLRRQLVLVALLLAAAAVVVWAPPLLEGGPAESTAWPQDDVTVEPAGSDAYMFVADNNGWTRTPDESVVVSTFDLRPQQRLLNLPPRIGRWHGDDVPNNAALMLEINPHAELFRVYNADSGPNDGRGPIWLRLLGSPNFKLFYHTPPICYRTNDWTLEPETTVVVPLGETALKVKGFVARQGPSSHLVLYTFLWPSKHRAMEEGATMVELAAPYTGSKDAALRSLKELLGLLFTDAPLVRQPEKLAPQHRVDGTFQDKVTLLGYDLSAPTVRPGDTVSLRLYWKVEAALPEEYTVFVHMLNRPEDARKGGVMVGVDRQPFAGFYPTTRWPVGRIVLESYDLQIPADAANGDREIDVGLYVSASQSRLRVQLPGAEKTADRVILGSVKVEGAGR